jgi:hypothetical protein
MVSIKMTGSLYATILKDLSRPHPFASERVGFVLARLGSLADSGSLVLLHRYHSIPDDQYIEDSTVGARIGSQAITWGMQEAYRGRKTREGVFHVHLHAHNGRTGMSVVDQREIPEMVRGFHAVGTEAAHGILIFSLNHGFAWVWPAGKNELVIASKICVIGHPLGVFERSAT